MSSATTPLPQLLPLHPPGVSPFVLAAQRTGDRHLAPYMRHHGYWELPETLLLTRILREGMNVVDIGAHIGYYAMLCGIRVGPGGHVRAYEPEPDNFRLLSANILLNNLPHVSAHRVAISSSASEAALYLSTENFGDHRLLPTPERACVPVSVLPLDQALADMRRVDFIKIDAQGMEPDILRGMPDTVARNHGRLACLLEFSPYLFALSGVSVAQFAEQLAAFDARVYTLGLANNELSLQRMPQLQAGLDSMAERLGRERRVDVSEDIFVCFGAQAERLWLDRYMQGA